MNREGKMDRSNGQNDFTVRAFRPEDAEGIVRLFLSVYGEGYPIKLFYDSRALTLANEEGRYLSIVAARPDGDVIGVEHLYRSAPAACVYEVGAGLVRKDCRNLGLIVKMLEYLAKEYVARRPGIEETFGEAVCNHPFTQKVIGRVGYIETGLEVALMPDEAYDREKSAAGRVAAVLAFRCFKPSPHRIYLPEPYEAILRDIYARLDDTREMERSSQDIPRSTKSLSSVEIFDFARVARIAIHVIGADFRQHIADVEKNAVERGVVVIQAWLRLDAPWVGAAAESLRCGGFFFGGPLPRWFGCDGLMLQKVLCSPDFDSIVLESDFAKGLLAYIKEDRTRAERFK